MNLKKLFLLVGLILRFFEKQIFTIVYGSVNISNPKIMQNRIKEWDSYKK